MIYIFSPEAVKRKEHVNMQFSPYLASLYFFQGRARKQGLAGEGVFTH